VAVLVLAFVVLAFVGSLRTSQSGASAVASQEPGSPPPVDVAPSLLDSPIGVIESSGPTTSDTAGPGSRVTTRPTTGPTATSAGCEPTDQDLYVYNPSRLEVAVACIRVTGTVQAIRHEADGDLHILLALDPAYRHVLTPANQGEELGDLVVEPVCVRSVSQADAIAICASDPNPFPGPFPVVGEHIWMEGRYVFDREHGGWAELHPLYRWGSS